MTTTMQIVYTLMLLGHSITKDNDGLYYDGGHIWDRDHLLPWFELLYTYATEPHTT
jgi:hypothetical protein